MKIGITYTGSDEKQQYYHQWLLAADEGLELVDLHPVPADAGTDPGLNGTAANPGLNETAANPGLNETAADPAGPNLEGFHGIVFSGGIDVHPSFYNKGIDYDNAPVAFNRERDEYEKQLFTAAINKRMPVLGICRGMQLINVLSGGTLKQDLGREGNDVHRAVTADKCHTAEVQPDNLLSAITGQAGTIHVNSAHHQVVDLPGKNLVITCHSAEGHPEAMEFLDRKDQPFLLCVQWHPERMFRFNLGHTAASAGIRKRFLQEVKSYLAT